MAKILVVNPPKRKAHKRRKASAAQLRALAKGRATLAARRHKKHSGTKTRRIVKRHHAVKHTKKRRARRISHMAFPNPFLGELALAGNPRRKHTMKHRRKSHRRARRGGLLRLNPGGALAAITAGPREMISGEFVKEAVSVTAGFLVPGFLMPRLPLVLRDATWKAYASKMVLVGGISAVAGMAVSKRVGKLVLLGGGVSILMDLYADFVAPMLSGVMAPRAVAPSSGTSMYYGNAGDPGMSDGYDLASFYGNAGDPGVSNSLGEAFAS